MRKLLWIAFAALCTSALAGNGVVLRPDANAVPGHYIVVLEDGVTRGDFGTAALLPDLDTVAQNVAQAYGGRLEFVYGAALNGFTLALDDALAERLARDTRVKYVEQDSLVFADTTQSNATWGLDRIDQASLPLSTTFTYNTTASNVNAYIIDTGIRATHANFGGRVSGGYTAITDGRGTSDCNGHGTHTAGTVGSATYGVAKGVHLVPVRVLNCAGSGTTSGVIAGVNWVTSNRVKPAVANMSLGGSASSSLDTAVKNSIAAGVTYAIAAGNSAANACNYSPARVAEALTVGATTRTDARASYSNYGTCLDLFAPGDGITSTYYSSDTATATMSGTSMAAPHVAGVAALYLATHTTATPAQVGSAIIALTTPNKVTNPGSGSPNRLLFTNY